MINNQNIGVLSEKVARLESDVKTLALPPVETTDEGKALVVNASGKWEAADAIPEVINALDSTSETAALSAAQGKALDAKITGLLKTKTVTDTTNQYGVIALHIRGGHVLSAKVTGVSANRTAITFTYGTDWFISLKDPTDLSNVQNTEITVEALYVE